MRFVNCQLTHRGRDFFQFGNFGRLFGQSASCHNKDNHDKDNENLDLGITVDDNSILDKSKSMMSSAKNYSLKRMSDDKAPSNQF